MVTCHRMDERWFKEQQKRAGVTADDIARRMGRVRSAVSHIYSGRQKMSLEWAQAFSDVLGVPVSTVLEKAGVASAEQAQEVEAAPRGGDVVKFVGRSPSDRHIAAVGEALGSRPGTLIWECRSRCMALGGILPGDYLLVDADQSERCSAGDIVTAEVHSPLGRKLVLRRYAPPVLVSAACPGEEETAHVVDGVNVVIRGKVVAVWRTKQ